MDDYTSDTQRWLEARYRTTDARGIYKAHQPIYGFRTSPCDGGFVERYTITWRILDALSRLDFRSMLDVGGSEGYKAALIRDTFGVDVRNCDLSAEACERAEAIFGISGEAIDIHNLPYADRSFDLVLCSETLEHVVDIRKATEELMRVADKYVVITVPREPEEVVRHNIEQKIPHAHIHALDIHSFDFAKEMGWRVDVQRMNSGRLKAPRALIEGVHIETDENGEGGGRAVWLKNAIVPVTSRVTGKRSVSAFLRFDHWLASRTDSYRSMCFTLSRDGAESHEPRPAIPPSAVLNFAVPFHYPAQDGR
jgi:SAM-dependent methyltransferase